MTTLDRLRVYIEGDSSSLDGASQHAVKSLDRLEKGLSAAKGQFSSYEKAVKSAATATETLKPINVIKGLKSAATAVASINTFLQPAIAAMRELYRVAEDGARVAAAEKFFVGAGHSIEQFRAATRGLISDADLIKKTNLADSMGITGAAFLDLSRIAHAAAAKTGQSFDHMLNSIALGTARESRLLLDNLGIIVNVKEAKLKYAQSLIDVHGAQQFAGMSAAQLAESLSDSAEKAALMQAINASQKGTLDQMAAAGGSAADGFDRMAASIDNVVTEFGRLIAQGTKFDPLIEALNTVAGLLSSIRKFGFGQIDFAGIVAKGVAAGPMGAVPVMGALLAKEVMGGTMAAQDEALKARQNLVAGMSVGGVSPDTALRLGQMTGKQRQQAEESMQLSAATKELIRQFLVLNDKIADGQYALKKAPSAGPEGAMDEFKARMFRENQAGGAQKDLEKTIKDTSTVQSVPGMAGLSMPSDVLQDEMERIADLNRRIQDAKYKGAKYLEEFAAEQADDSWIEEHNYKVDEEAEKAAKEEAMAREAAAIALKEFEFATREAADAQLASIIRTTTSAFTGGGAQVAGSLSGMAIGSLVGSPQAGEAIGELLTAIFERSEPLLRVFDAMTAGFEEFVDRGFGEVFSAIEPLAPILFQSMTALGVLVSAVLRPFLGAVGFATNLLGGMVTIFNALEIALSPIVEIFVSLLMAIVPVLGSLGGDAANNFALGIRTMTTALLDGAIWLNNVIVTAIQGIGSWLEDLTGDDFGLEDFGQLLSREDFVQPIEEATNDNTDATKDNTRAVQQLSRDIKNMPAGYKVNLPIYESTDPVTRVNPGTPLSSRLSSGGGFRHRL